MGIFSWQIAKQGGTASMFIGTLVSFQIFVWKFARVFLLKKNMNKQRILIFQDGIKLTTPQERWEDIDMLTNELVTLIQHPGFDYAVVDADPCIKNLSRKLEGQKPSCIIDLSGFFRRRIDQNSGIPIFDSFRLSRVRNVSSPLLDGVGFISTLDDTETQGLREEIKLAAGDIDGFQPFIFDDVSWSGRTMLEAINRLGLDLPSINVGLLVCNEGVFGDKPTQLTNIRAGGARVFTGAEVHTPQDDGFHLVDFLSLNLSEDVFDAVIAIQKFRERRSAEGAKEKEINLEIKAILIQMREKIFPNAKTSEEMANLKANGRLINKGGVSKGSFFDVNPPNWLLPSFSMRVQSSTLKENKENIIGVIRELRDIIDPSKETKREIEPTTSEITFRGIER